MKRIHDVRRRLIDRFEGLTGGYVCDDRRGSTLVVVIALLGALLLLGMLVLTLASQEEVNAEYYADAAKDPQSDFDPDAYFDFVLRQVIIGPDPTTERQSVLSGGRWSLLANMLGDDMAPFNGQGVRPVWDATNTRIDLDQNYDFVPDGMPGDPLLTINNSPAATGALPNVGSFPKPDTGITYPDINSPFIQYDGLAPLVAGGTIRAILPSYHRPQYLDRGNPSTWYTDPNSVGRVMRPHVHHRAVMDNGTVRGLPTASADNARFVSTTFPDSGASPINPFPFPTGAEGPWSGAPTADYSGFEVDTDNDGTPDAVYLDLGFPAEPVGGGRYRVPLVAISIKDAAALFQLNAHGNNHGSVAAGSLQQNPFGGRYQTSAGPDGLVGTGDDTLASYAGFISKSNTGRSSYEVNPQWALSAAPLAAAQKPHRYFFHGTDPADAYELGNMEWWFLLMGAPVYGSSASNIDELVYGRYSGLAERSQLMAAVSAGTKIPSAFCWPGRSYVDDNFNGNDGASSYFPPDFHGTGQTVLRTTGSNTGRLRLRGQYGQALFPLYDNFGVDYRNVYYNRSVAQYSNSLVRNPVVSSPTSPLLRDEPTEVRLDSRLGTSTYDAPFEASEAEYLQMSNLDIAAAGVTSRVEKLAPVNFGLTATGESIRRLFTPVCWDLKSFGKSYFGSTSVGTLDVRRGWEHANDPAYNRVVFPPAITDAARTSNGNAQQPFRPALRDLLLVDPNDPNKLRDVQQRFSVNHVLEYGPNGRLRFRPLTAHPSGLGAAPVSTISSLAAMPANQQIPENVNSVADAEYLARRDRQLLCRDIYVMLYTFCGGNDSVNYNSDNSGQALYTFTGPDGTPPNDPTKDDQCRLMAQFAVNLVDQLDADDVITTFEYDVNLADGWGLGDDPYSTGDDTNAQVTGVNSQRRVVYGLEEHQLSFSEALAIWAPRVKNAVDAPIDQSSTEWDDAQTKSWLFFELQNTSPRNVDLSSQAWQVAVLPKVTGVRDYTTPVVGMSSATITGEERRLVFKTGTVRSPNNGPLNIDRSVVSVKTDSQRDLDPSNSPRPSHFVLNPHKGHGDPMVDTGANYVLAPRSHMGDASAPPNNVEGFERDLVIDWNSYRVNRAPGSSTTPGDGNEVVTTSTSPAGTDLLHIDTAGDPDAIDETFDPGPYPYVNGLKIILELRRRMNPYRTMPDPDPAASSNHAAQSNDNPWIVVDKIEVPLHVFKLNDGAIYTGIRPQLLTLESVERGEMLNRNNLYAFRPVSPMYDTTKGTGGEDDWRKYVRDSVGQRNYNQTPTSPQPTNFTLTQTRFDRTFSTVAELFNVALYGPADLTTHLANQSQPYTPLPAPITGPDQRNMTAGKMFLHPKPLNPGTLAPITVPDFTNRWYRLLEFVETPSLWEMEMQQQWVNPQKSGRMSIGLDAGAPNAPNPIGAFRTPGRVQLNMLRDPRVLAGLLDDRDITSIVNPTAAPFLQDSVEGATRDWWFQFLLARDGRDPQNTNQILPGIAPDYSGTVRLGSRPFQPVETTLAGANGIEDTVYRGLPADTNAGRNDARNLFDISARDSMGNLQNVDPEVKHRLLGKVVNNSTLRTNTYFVFIQIDFFEASEKTDVSGAKWYRVGEKRTTDAPLRGFFVLDRTQALDLVKPQHLPTPSSTGHYSFDQSLNYEPLILHRRLIN